MISNGIFVVTIHHWTLLFSYILNGFGFDLEILYVRRAITSPTSCIFP
jgi:hypothetical protein